MINDSPRSRLVEQITTDLRVPKVEVGFRFLDAETGKHFAGRQLWEVLLFLLCRSIVQDQSGRNVVMDFDQVLRHRDRP